MLLASHILRPKYRCFMFLHLCKLPSNLVLHFSSVYLGTHILNRRNRGTGIFLQSDRNIAEDWLYFVPESLLCLRMNTRTF